MHKMINMKIILLPGLDEAKQVITCSVTYIRPSRDLLVSSGAVRLLSEKCYNFKQISVRGGHFIAQSHPVECAKIISNAVNM